MNDKSLRGIPSAGGGTAGWMAAAPLALKLRRGDGPPCGIVLVEARGFGARGEREGTPSTIPACSRSLGFDTGPAHLARACAVRSQARGHDAGPCPSRGMRMPNQSLRRRPQRWTTLRLPPEMERFPKKKGRRLGASAIPLSNARTNRSPKVLLI